MSSDLEQPKTGDLVPRMMDQGYTSDDVAFRRDWVEKKTGASLGHIANCSIDTESMRGNIENPIGSVQMPLGIAGPLKIDGEHAKDIFYVPLATTEGALVRSYERGMALLTRAGGASVRIYQDENRIAPVFVFDTVSEAHAFAQRVPQDFERLKSAAESTTSHGKLLRVECYPVGREVQVNFCFYTADAQGMNMIMKAADHACLWLVENGRAKNYFIFSGLNSEKRASGFLFAGGKGKKVVAGALLPARMVRLYLHTSPEDLCRIWRHTVLGHLNANAVGYNGHYANGLTALFVACGQDVANVANASVGITSFELTDDGDLYASVTLPSLSVATVGGGTRLGSSQECLEMLGCAGSGHAPKFAEIVAATLLAGELSMGAAIASGEFVAAHESYGRNRPHED
ncbi:MAG: hydroxymethylglutaryl-CoA reductase [Candidatus Latescibacteria bacterium]|nr:hydroxymethylglutaryl-CoA reductase [Candidatus Latescibacterota bacterium]